MQFVCILFIVEEIWDLYLNFGARYHNLFSLVYLIGCKEYCSCVLNDCVPSKMYSCFCVYEAKSCYLFFVNKEREDQEEGPKMASALRAAILGHLRVPVVANGSKLLTSLWIHRTTSVRSMSSHDDHLEKTQVIDRILDIVKSFSKVDPSKVTPEVHFQKDLGLDSLDNVEIIMAIEEEFKLEIPDKEADKIDSCALAIEYVYNHPMAS
ncbi:hypothetical protein L1987_56943 [Smallanthus sonchifolius]|uniref:Uncharacterized protein n=1 Tax=Smallanthus sonchifolius TaxID=185202 RepID=A0ACB9DC73_9ASTR|nr:hypothetical protein L1987_56943 [Smallanthus sonchifolius]